MEICEPLSGANVMAWMLGHVKKNKVKLCKINETLLYNINLNRLDNIKHLSKLSFFFMDSPFSVPCCDPERFTVSQGLSGFQAKSMIDARVSIACQTVRL